MPKFKMKRSLKFLLALNISILFVLIANIDWNAASHYFSGENIKMIFKIWLYYEVAFALMYFTAERNESIKRFGNILILVILGQRIWSFISPILDKELN